MKNILTTGFALCASMTLSQAITIASYDFTSGASDPLAATFTDANLTVSAITSTAFDLVASSINDTLNVDEARGLANGTTDDIDGAFTSGQFLEFTLTAADGYVIDLAAINFEIFQVNRGANDFAFRTSADAFLADVDSGGIPRITLMNGGTPQPRTADFSGADFDELSEITIRFAYDDRQNDGAGSSSVILDNLAIDGAVVAIPEPSSAALLGLGGLAILARRRR